MTKLSVVLPVHNQEDMIEKTFKPIYKKISKIIPQIEFILVENGSEDDTLTIVKSLAKKYKKTKWATSPKGYGTAILKGLEIAKGDYLCYMPSDGQVDIGVFPKLWQAAKSNKWQIIKVKRKNRESTTRSLVSKAFVRIISTLFKTPYIDINGSPRIIKTEDIRSLKLRQGDSFIDAEMLIKIAGLKWKIKEIPMKNLERTGGKSSRNYKTFLEFFKNIISYKLAGDAP